LKGENLQILPRFFADFGIFKPYSFGIAQDITNMKQRPEITDAMEYFFKISGPGGAVLLGTMHFCKFLEVAKLPKAQHFATYLRPPSSEHHQIFADASHVRHTLDLGYVFTG